MSHVARIDREIYKVSKVDIGFTVVNVAIARIIAKELDAADAQHQSDLLAIETAEKAMAIERDRKLPTDQQMADLIFDIIKHGDDAHQGWLRLKSLRVAEAIRAMAGADEVTKTTPGWETPEITQLMEKWLA